MAVTNHSMDAMPGSAPLLFEGETATTTAFVPVPATKSVPANGPDTTWKSVTSEVPRNPISPFTLTAEECPRKDKHAPVLVLMRHLDVELH